MNTSQEYKIQTFEPGESVIYVPMHALGDITHKDAERGVVHRQSEISGHVFVRFCNKHSGQLDETPKGCYPEDLRKQTTKQ